MGYYDLARAMSDRQELLNRTSGLIQSNRAREQKTYDDYLAEQEAAKAKEGTNWGSTALQGMSAGGQFGAKGAAVGAIIGALAGFKKAYDYRREHGASRKEAFKQLGNDAFNPVRGVEMLGRGKNPQLAMEALGSMGKGMQMSKMQMEGQQPYQGPAAYTSDRINTGGPTYWDRYREMQRWSERQKTPSYGY